MTTDVTVGDEGVVSDATLIAAVRTGDRAAAGRLYERHSGAAWVVARQYTDSRADADDVVADSFAAVLGALHRGNGPDAAFRAYLFTVVRRVAADRRTSVQRVRPTDDLATLEAGTALAGTAEEPALAGFERGVVARAFHSLPERWQAVLWHAEVEGLTPAQVAPLLGMSANGVAALSYRAREGLRQAYLQQHLGEPLSGGCRAVAGKLGSYVRGGLGARDTAAVEQHLETCGDCRALVLELGDVNHGMRAFVAPLVLGLAGLGALSHVLPVGGGLAAGLAAAAKGGGPGAIGVGSGAAGAGAGTGAAGAGAGGAGTGVGGAGAAGTGAGGAGATGAGGAAAAGASGAGAAGAGAGGAGAGAAAVGGGAAGAGVAGAGAAAAGAELAAGAGAGVGALGATGAAAGLGGAVAGAGAAGATVAAGGLAGLFAAVPAVAAVTVGGVLVAAAAVGGTILLAQGDPAADPLVTATSPAPGGAAPAPGASDPAPVVPPPTGAAPAPTDLPAVAPTSVVVGLTGGAGTGGQGGSGTGGGGGTGGGDPAPAPTTPVDPGPTTPVAPPTTPVEPPPTPQPTDPSTGTLLLPAALAVDAPADGLALDAGVADQTLEVAVQNTGDQPAQNLTADVTLPGGVTLAGLSLTGATSALSGRFAPLVGGGWVCIAGDAPSTAQCTLAELPGRTTATLVLRVAVDESYDGTGGDVQLHLSGSGLDYRSAPIPVRIHPSPARLALRGTPGAPTFVAGVAAPLTLDLVNAGGSAGDVTATVTLPPGLTWSAGGPDGPDPAWACAAAPEAGDGTVVTCTRDAPARGRVPLVLDLVAGAPDAVTTRTVAIALAPGSASTTTVGFGVTQARLSIDDPEVQLHGGRGTVAFRVTAATGADAAAALGTVAVVHLPGSLEADPDGVDPRLCNAVDERTFRCALGDLAPGASSSVLLDVRAEGGAAAGSVEIDASAAGAAASASVRVSASTGGLAGRVRFDGGWASTEVGAPLLSCDGRSWSCDHALAAGTGDDQDLTMWPLDVAGGGRRGHVAVPVSSSTRLTVPSGRSIAFAGLYWSADRAARDRWSGDLAAARLRGPAGSWTSVSARPGDVTTVRDDDGRTYYQAFADVTAQVARELASPHAGETTTWSVADTAVSATRHDRHPSYYAGWSLVVIYADPTSAASVTVYDGGAWIGAAQSEPALRFLARAGTDVRVGAVAWDGDRGLAGDRLVLADAAQPTGTALVPQRWNGWRPVGGGSAANAFDSTATGWWLGNALGVDAKGFAAAPLTDRVGSLTATAGADRYLLGVVTLRTSAPPDSRPAAAARFVAPPVVAPPPVHAPRGSATPRGTPAATPSATPTPVATPTTRPTAAAAPGGPPSAAPTAKPTTDRAGWSGAGWNRAGSNRVGSNQAGWDRAGSSSSVAGRYGASGPHARP